MALQDPEAERLLPDVDEETRMESVHAVEPGGSVSSKGEAMARTLAALPASRPIGRLLEASTPLTERAYGLVSDNRDRIGPHIPERWVARADERIRRRGHAA